MICDGCGAKNAHITFNVLFNGQKIARAYCAQCAKKLRRGDAHGAQLALLNTLPIADLSSIPPCPVCGTTFASVQKTGRMGCASCYRTFGEATDIMLQRLNGTQHQEVETTPFEPIVSNEEKRLLLLKGELAQAINLENYERAAEIRDEINALSALLAGGNA